MLRLADSLRMVPSSLRRRSSLYSTRVRRGTALLLCIVVLPAMTLLSGCEGDTGPKVFVVGLSPFIGVNPGSDKTLPPAIDFQGNATSQGNDAADSTAAAAGVPGTIFARQSDCSVAGGTFTNVALTSMNGYSGTFSGTFTPATTPNYGATLHTLAGLNTKSGSFPNGCTDKTAGLGLQSAALLALTPAGVYVGAVTDNIHNTLYIGAVNSSAGTFAGSLLSLTNVIGVTIGDVNSEGVRQLIVENYVPSPTNGYPTYQVFTINVHADGTSDAPVQIASPYPQFSLVVDDVNGDGKQDLIFGPQTYSSAAVTVLPGKGDGTFGAPISSVTVNAAGASMVTGDFNGDGKRDLFFGNVLFGNGDGTFTLGSAVPDAAAFVVNYAVGDFNKDGKDDIAAYTPGGVSIFLSNGDGTFAPTGPMYAGLQGSFSLYVTDIDGDGNLDLVVGQGQSGLYLPPQNANGIIMFLMGNGDGTFLGASSYAHSAGSGSHGGFVAGDFNKDGNLDVLSLASNAGNSVTGLQLLTGNGKGALTPQAVNTSVQPYFVTAADIDGDGKLDAVTLVNTTNAQGYTIPALVTLKGNGDGTFATPVSYAVGSSSANGYFSSDLALGDTRATGKPDAIFSQTGSLYLLPNQGDGTFASPVLLDTESGFQALAVVDLNGDGKADIVALTTAPVSGTLDTTGSLLVYLSHGDGTFASPVTIASSLTDAQDVIVGDMNNDGKPDIVLLTSNASASTASLTSYLGHGDGTFSAGVASTLAGQGYGSLATADANGDGHLDILIGGNPLASMALGNGDGTFATNYGISIGPNTKAVGFADLNNDGRPDLLLATSENLVTSLNQYGNIVTQTPTTITLALSPGSPAAGQSVQFSATVAPSSGSGTPSGSVTFLDGMTVLGTGTLSSGVATFTGSLAAGMHSITASYSGDVTYAASVSTAYNFTIPSGPSLAATATQLTASPTTAAAGTAVSLTATVTGTSGTSTPTGTITFNDGTSPIGTANLVSGVAAVSISTLAVGPHTVTAAYGGDEANASSTSAAVTVNITAVVTADFSLALSPTTGTVTQGSSASSTVTLTPVSGFNQAVRFACSGLPANATCTFSPASLTLTGANASTATLTIATDVKTASFSAKPFQTSGEATSFAALSSGAGLLLILMRRRRIHAGLWRLPLSLLAALLLSLAMGCGAGNLTQPKTPTGISQITVTATAGATIHTATYRLTVQ